MKDRRYLVFGLKPDGGRCMAATKTKAETNVIKAYWTDVGITKIKTKKLKSAR